jgi:hypothetical protein
MCRGVKVVCLVMRRAKFGGQPGELLDHPLARLGLQPGVVGVAGLDGGTRANDIVETIGRKHIKRRVHDRHSRT